MKLLLISLSCLFLSAPVMGNEYAAPPHIKNVFAGMFPGVENVYWEKWQENVVAIFRDEEGLKKAFFNQEGVWQETRLRTRLEQLPLYVQTTLHERYPEMEVTYAGKVYRPQEVVYRVESESREAVIVKLFEEGGTLISEQTFRFSTGKVHVIGYVPTLPKREMTVEPATRTVRARQ